MEIKKSMRRVLSILLVMTLLLSALPAMGVTAETTDADTTGALGTEGTVSTDATALDAVAGSVQMATTDATVPYGPIALVSGGKFTFTLLSAAQYSEMTLTFADQINKRTGATVTVGKSGSSTTYEMIIGQYSARSESTNVYNSVANYRNDNASDYVIRLVGTKLYVAATTEYAMQNALDYFLDTYVKDDQGEVSAVKENGNVVEHRPHHYFWDTLGDGSHVEFSLAGHKISEYVIRTERYPSQLVQRAAAALQAFFMENYGVVLPIKPVNTEGTNVGIYGPEFRIGPMNGAVNMIRPNYTSFTQDDWQEHITLESDGLISGDYGYYEMSWDGDHIQLNGGSVYAISAATVRLMQVFEDLIKSKSRVMTPATTFSGNYESGFDYLYGGGYDTVDFSLVDGFGLVYADEFDYTGSDKKVYETVRSKWTLSQDMTYPTAGAALSKETCTVFPDVYGENWWVAADTSGNNYLFEITKKHDKADQTIGNTTYSFYEGVRLASQNKWGFRYGIWETRLVMGTHNGSSSAVWSHTREPYPADTGYWHEIDVYENYGQDCFVPCMHSFDETMTSGYPHANDTDPENPLLMQGQFDTLIPSMDGSSRGGTNYQSESWEEPASGEHFYDTFHHVSVDWSYDYLRIYLDGQMVSRMILGEDGPTGDGGVYENLFDCYRAGQTLKLSNGVGTNWYSRTRPVGEATASQPFTPDYWLGEAVNSFFEAQIVDYTRIYQTSNADIHYEPAKNEMLFDERFEFNETTQWRYGQFTKAQSFERYDPNEVLSLGSDAIVATEEQHLAGFSSAKVTAIGNGLATAPQMVLNNVFDRPFTVEQGKDYDVTFYVKVPTTESAYDLKYWLTAADDGVLLDAQTVAVTEKGGWRRVDIAVRDCPTSGDLRLSITGSTDAMHTFYLDDIYVQEIISRPVDETAMNFESAEVGTVLMSNNSGQNGSSVVISNKNSYSGSQSALFTTDTHSQNQRAQMNVTDADGNPIKLEQGKDYWLNFKLYIDKAYYSAADVDASGNILTLKQEPFNFYAACVPDSELNTYFSNSFPYVYTDANDVMQMPYKVYEENGSLDTANSSPGTAKAEHQTRNEWIDVSVKIEDCAVSGNLRLGISHYAQTQFYCYVDDIKVYEGAQNVTVKFDTNGGSGSYSDKAVERGSTIAAVADPTRDHYIFRGWHTDPDFTEGTYFVFGETPILGYNGDTVTLYARWQGAEHDYDNACDAICNWCGDVRAVGDHAYDHACDTDCNICGVVRVTEHQYDNACDAVCNVCGHTRAVGDHVYDDVCDADCNVCGDERDVGHVYDNGCDAACNVCGEVRAVGDHVYTNGCDSTCNECGNFRYVRHQYSGSDDIDCDLCGLLRATGDDTTEVLADKSVLFAGDSITYGYGEEQQGVSRCAWAQRIADRYGMLATNNGMNGYALSDVRADQYLHTTLTAGDYDYVILQGGINDVMDSVAVGTVAATKNLEDFDTSTFAGGLERYFYYATTMYPDARIGFILTYDVPASDWGGETRNADAYWQIAREICVKWNISYLDLYSARYSDELLQTDTDRYLMDTLHLGSDGYDLIAPYIAEWMATLTKYSEIGIHLDDGSVDMEMGGTCAALHTYDGVCDADCNECGAMRAVEHTFSFDCDRVCDLCGSKRVAVDEHDYDNACDVDCNECGDVRAVGDHVYDNACDADCNECGDIRTVGDHVYDNACDADCNECGNTRTVGDHVYDNACDADCNECGDIRTVGDHVYDNACDVDCNECGDVRPIEHTYAGACDAECAICDHIRDTDSAHTYTDIRDTDCGVCGATRTLTAIAVSKLPDTLSYLLNTALDTTGMELTLTYDDGASGVITDGYAVSGFDSSAAGECVVTVTYGGKTATLTVTVIEYVAGDVSGDGELNNKDLSVFMRYLNGWDETVDERALDVNADGKINNKDYVILMRYLNGWDVVLK